MLSLLIGLLIFCLIAAIVWWVIGQLSLPPPIRMVVIVVFALIAIIALLNYMPGLSLPHGRFG